MDTEKIRRDFESVFKIPEGSGIEWYAGREQYLTKIDMWKTFAKGLTDAFQGWRLSVEHYAI